MAPKSKLRSENVFSRLGRRHSRIPSEVGVIYVGEGIEDERGRCVAEHVAVNLDSKLGW